MKELWAKDTGETLLEHTNNVCKIISVLCRNLPLSADCRERIFTDAIQAGIFHDIGKAASGFQRSLKTHINWGHRHEILSAAVASSIMPDLPKEVIFAIITHHRSIPESLVADGEKCLPPNELPFDEENLEDTIWNSMLQELAEEWGSAKDVLKCLMKYHINEFINIPSSINISDIGIGLSEKILNRNFQKKVSEFNRGYASLLRGILMTADHMASAHQFDIPEIPLQKNYLDLINQKELRGNYILPFQRCCAEATGNVILKAPTGSGKTAAMLLWAANNQAEKGRLFYVLPHTASINSMYNRLKEIYNKNNVGILHHKNTEYLYRIFEMDYPSNKATELAKSISDLAKELYYPIKVTTPHQILRIALCGKGWEIGLAEFPNACFVFDEIHAFEPLITGLTIATVKWLKSMGSRILFASATLPLFLEEILKNELDINEIIAPNSQIDGDKDVLNKIRHNIEVRQGSLYDNIDIVINEIKKSDKTVLIICNHVDTSRKIYEKLKNHFNIGDIKLFHARFNAKDRFNIETIIQSKNPPKVLVSTQAIEVSLDLDYNCGYIEPAPADALGQRLGRINRKGSLKSPAKVVVFEEPSLKSRENSLYLPYDEEITKRTINCLKENDSLLSEQQLTDIVNEIYKGGYSGNSKEDYLRGLNNSTVKQFNEDMIAGANKPWIEDIIEGTDGFIEVLPYKLYSDFSRLREEKKYLEAKMLLVPIQARQNKRLFKEKVLNWNEKIYEYTVNLEYSSDSGLNISKQIENIF